MTITNISKPTTSIINQAKINSGETWATITTTWASETRTWAEAGSSIANSMKQSSSITNTPKP